MEEKKSLRDEETVPIIAPLKVLDQKTINKRFGWWSAVVLLESYGRKQVCFYLWQKKEEGGRIVAVEEKEIGEEDEEDDEGKRGKEDDKPEELNEEGEKSDCEGVIGENNGDHSTN